MIRDLLAWACKSSFPCDEVAEAGTGAEALAACRAVRPDLVILDLELPDADGFELAPELRREVPSVKILALSSHTDQVTVHRIATSLFDGFVDKNAQPMQVLREAISTVMEGRQYLSPTVREVWESLHREPAAFNKVLSEREQQILSLVGRGFTNTEIADRLQLKAVTVQNHRCNIMAKLGIHTTSHLMRYAAEKGFTRLRLSEAS